VVDAFYRRHEEIAASGDVRGKLLEIAGRLGIDEAAFDRVVTNEAAFEPLSQLARQAVAEFGLEGTPTFFVNGKRVVGEVTIDEMAAVIDAKLAESGH
jgi:protein-disulfide isomerase